MSALPEFTTRPCGHCVPKGRKKCPYCQTPWLSAKPLEDLLRTRTRQLGSVDAVSIEVATRLGWTQERTRRQITRILSGSMSKVTFDTADSFAVALDIGMPAAVWGDEWDFCNPVEIYGDEDTDW